MKAIKQKLIFLTALIFIFGCTNKEELFTGDYNFVRFGLMLNSNNEPITYPKVVANVIEVDAYKPTTSNDIKIPIVITSNAKNEPTEVFYEITTQGSFTDFTVSPANKVIIPAGKLVDTLTISFNKRWTSVDVDKIQLKITKTTNPKLAIGWPNNYKKLDLLTITLGDLTKTRYSFDTNLYNIAGQANEELLVPIKFTQPVTNAMVAGFNFITPQFTALSACDGSSANYNYSLTQQPFTGSVTKIFYKLKILETTTLPSSLKLTLNPGLAGGFEAFGTTESNVVKPEINNRQGDVATNWYNVADANYRTFGKAWYYDPVTLQCRWSTFFAFTKPVAVPPGSQFDNGQGYHKYKIGFVSPNAPIGTNPFDFQRYYNNAKTISPAFTILEALEFYPTNGNSTSTGVVRVVPQTLSFIKPNNATVTIPICGSGNYYFNAVFNRWEMYLDVKCDETAINGNPNVVRSMYIYSNNNSSANPTNLTINCSQRNNL